MVAVVGQLEAAGQREVLGQLHRVLLLPLVDQVVRRPTVWKIQKKRIRIPFWLSSTDGNEMSGDFFHPCFRPSQVLLIRGDREQSKALGQLEDVREDERARRLQSNRCARAAVPILPSSPFQSSGRPSKSPGANRKTRKSPIWLPNPQNMSKRDPILFIPRGITYVFL